MNLQVNDTGRITFGDGSTGRVKIVQIDTHSYVPTDYWFSYQEGETNQQIKHPDYEDRFPLPEGLVDIFFTKDLEAKSDPKIDDFEAKLQEYLDREMKPENHAEARRIFKRLVELKSEEEVIRDYFT